MEKRLFVLLKKALYRLGLIADFVVDFGADDNWVWRKWNSGIGECWLAYDGDVGAYTATAPGTGLHYGRYITFNYPFTFIEVPSVTALAAQDNGFTYTFSTVAASSLLNKFTIYWASNNDVDNCRLSIHVTGYWKTPTWGGQYLVTSLKGGVRHALIHLVKEYSYGSKRYLLPTDRWKHARRWIHSIPEWIQGVLGIFYRCQKWQKVHCANIVRKWCCGGDSELQLHNDNPIYFSRKCIREHRHYSGVGHLYKRNIDCQYFSGLVSRHRALIPQGGDSYAAI